MTTPQVDKASVVFKNSPIQDYAHPTPRQNTLYMSEK